MYIYIYVGRERERESESESEKERDRCIYICSCVKLHVYFAYVYICVYIYMYIYTYMHASLTCFYIHMSWPSPPPLIQGLSDHTEANYCSFAVHRRPHFVNMVTKRTHIHKQFMTNLFWGES